MRFALALALVAFPAAAAAKDLSANSLATVHDLMAPYRGATVPLDADADPKAVKQALAILKQERLVDFPRPTTASLGVADKLGKALAMGQRTRQFLPGLGAVRDALVHQDDKGARAAIQSLYVAMGRAKPEGAALDPLVKAARAVVGAEPPETERVSIERPGYKVVIENARAAGEARVAVHMNKGPDGKPARVEFKGDVRSEPNRAGDDLLTSVVPDPAPSTMTSAQSEVLRPRLNGKWIDQNGVPYDISGEGSLIVVTERKAGETVKPHRGTYELGIINARFPITRAEDMSGPPPNVLQQLARMGLHFDVSLAAVNRGSKLDGTWSSQHVTYSSSGVVERVHDPYDVKLVLRRDNPPLEIHFTDAEFKRLSEAEIYVVPGTDIGTGEVWIEAVAQRNDPDFDDAKTDQVAVTVKSTSDRRGVRVTCVETAAASRVFRSSARVLLHPQPTQVSP